MKIADLSEVSFYVAGCILQVAISKHKLFVFLIQSHELLQPKQSQFGIGARVSHKLKQLGGAVLSYLGQTKNLSPSQEHRFSGHSAAAPTAARRDQLKPATMSQKFVSGWKRGNRDQLDTQDPLW